MVVTFFTSCASLYNRPTTKLKLYSEEPFIVTSTSDTINPVNGKAEILAARSKRPLEVSFIDSTTNIIKIAPINSFMFWYNVGTLGIGMPIDENKDKRYGYPSRVYLSGDTEKGYYRGFERPHYKNEIRARIYLPIYHSYSFKPEEESRKTQLSMMGLGLGLDYFHHENQYLNLSTSFVLLIPFVIIDPHSEPYEMFTTYLTLTNNHRVRRLTHGYGITYGKTFYSDYDVKQSYGSIGAILSSHYRTGDHFSFGMVYRPTFLQIGSSAKYVYEQVIGIEVAWSINLK